MGTKAEKWIPTLGWNTKLGLFSLSFSFCVKGAQAFACMVMELNAQLHGSASARHPPSNPPTTSISFPLTGLAGLQC